MTTIDRLAGGGRPTFVKLDVEGDELEALRRRQGDPGAGPAVVAVCLYHRPEDLWTIPLFLSEALPAHRLYPAPPRLGWIRARGLRRSAGALRSAANEQREPPALSRLPAMSGGSSTGSAFWTVPLGDGYDVVVCSHCGAGFADGIPSQDGDGPALLPSGPSTPMTHAAGRSRPGIWALRDDGLARWRRTCARATRASSTSGAPPGASWRRSRNAVSQCGRRRPLRGLRGAAKRLHGLDVRTATLGTIGGLGGPL